MQTWLKTYIKIQIGWSEDFPAWKYYRFPMMQWARTVQQLQLADFSKLSAKNELVQLVIEGEGLFYDNFVLD